MWQTRRGPNDDIRWSRPAKLLLFSMAATLAALSMWASHPPEVDPSRWLRWFATPEPRSEILPADLPKHELPESVRDAVDASRSSITISQPLILSGTEPGRNALEGSAFLGVDAAHAQVYAAGAILANGSRLKEIYRDRVILERDGHRFELMLNGVAAGEVNDALMTGGTAVDVLADADTSEALTRYIRPNPSFANGKFTGYRLQPGERPDAYRRLGLEPGDLLTAIDGIPLEDRRQGLAALRQIAGGTSLVVTIDRRGTPMTLTLDGSLLTETAY